MCLQTYTWGLKVTFVPCTATGLFAAMEAARSSAEFTVSSPVAPIVLKTEQRD